MLRRDDAVKLLGLAGLAFFIRAIPHMFIIPYVGIEEGYMFIFAERISNGVLFELKQYPHTAILGVVGLHKLTQIPIVVCGSMWAPLMGGLSTVVMYFVLRDVVNVKNPFWGTLLFMSLDSHIYRSTLFGNAAEATGILLMLIFVWVYYTRSKFLSVLLIPFLLWTHLITFGMSIIFIFSDIVVGMDWSKRIFTILGVGIMSVIALFVFSPYNLAFANVEYIIRNFNIDILSKISTEDISLLISTFLGTIIMFGVSIVFGDRKKIPFIPLVLVGLVGIFSLFWYSMMVSPYRVMVYAGMLAIMGCSRVIETRGIGQYLIICLTILMMIQVSCFGWRTHNKIFDAVTHDEYEMVKWLKENDSCVWYSEVYWDDPGTDALVLMFDAGGIKPDVDNVMEYKGWKETPELVKLNDEHGVSDTEEYFVNRTSGRFPRIKYVIYSDRFAKRALFRFPDRAGRMIYRRYSIVDIWKSDPDWEVVYEAPGGRIYRRCDYEP